LFFHAADLDPAGEFQKWRSVGIAAIARRHRTAGIASDANFRLQRQLS
jgi:hypothetical protein